MAELKKRSGWYVPLFVIFTFFSVALVFGEDGGDRILGIIGIFLFGFGGLSIYIPKGRRYGGTLNKTVIHGGRAQNALVFELDRRRQRLGAIGALGFTAIGGLMIFFSSELSATMEMSELIVSAVGGLATITFGYFFVAGMKRWDDPPHLALVEEALIVHVGAKRVAVPWEAIELIGVLTTHGHNMLAIAVGDRSQLEVGPITRLLMPVSRKMSGAELSYPLDSFVSPGETVLATVKHFFDNPAERKKLTSGEAHSITYVPT